MSGLATDLVASNFSTNSEIRSLVEYVFEQEGIRIR